MRDSIRAIVADADAAYRHDSLWPADDWDAWTSPLPLKNLYLGAAGVIWAPAALRRRGVAEPRLDLADAALATLAGWRDRPDFFTGVELPEPRESSLLEGETGILLVAWRLAPSADLADSLLARVRANRDNEAEEVMWGAPGTLLAALAMLDSTGEERWRDAWLESAAAVWSGATPTGSGGSGSTASGRVGWARRTASSASSVPCSTAASCSPTNGVSRSAGRRLRCSPATPSSRMGSPTGP